jgi:hypothetical protein
MACLKCNSLEAQMHHEDYNNPMLVFWMCPECRVQYHKEINQTDRRQAQESRP